MLVDPARLEREYFERQSDLERSRTTGQFRNQRASRLIAARLIHRSHILAITQAICDFRHMQCSDGPLFMGRDTHALSARPKTIGSGGARHPR